VRLRLREDERTIAVNLAKQKGQLDPVYETTAGLFLFLGNARIK
jgi:hypothetical protein